MILQFMLTQTLHISKNNTTGATGNKIWKTMDFLVSFELNIPGHSIRALITAERFLAAVCSHVGGELVFLNAGKLTHFTVVLFLT